MSLEALESAFADRARAAGGNGRRAALDALLESGLPDRKSELWKYTKAAPLAEFAIGALTATTPAEPADAHAARAELTERFALDDKRWAVVFIDGRLDEALTRLPPGMTLEEANGAGGTGTTGADDALALINAALPTAELSLTVAEDAIVEDVLHVVHGVTTAGVLSQVRLIVDMGANSRLTLAEHFADQGDAAHMHNTCLSVYVAEGARLHMLRLQSLSAEALQVTRIDAAVAARGALDTLTVDAGGKTVRNDLNVRLLGEGARVDMRGVYLGDHRQHIDNHTRVDHVARDTVSREDYRGILRDRSRGVFNGKVYVHEGADGTDAAQSNPNLLLSDHAEIDTKPELEIYADDVKCAHGATVGQIDETSLFYLRSRGIDEATAVQLLTYAFCRAVLTDIENDTLRIRAEQLVAEQIPDFSALELIT